MAKKSLKKVSIFIDKLSNSIENTISGDSFPTELTPLTKEELSTITKKKRLEFQLEKGARQ